MTSPLVLPQINLNGTSKQQLIEQQLGVAAALRTLLKAMGEAAPHGRDYQFRPAEYRTAGTAWAERVAVIHGMLMEIETHALAIHDIP